MLRLVGRGLMCAAAGFAGTAAGSVIHQLRTSQDRIDRGEADLVVTAPPITAGIAAAVGMLFGRTGALIAFSTGALLTALAGTALDDRLIELAGQARADDTSSSQSSA